MQPLTFGKKQPLTKAQKILSDALKNAGPVFTIPAGPRLNLLPIGDRFFITSPDEGQEERGKIGGIHLPENSSLHLAAYAEVTVLAVGPDVKGIEIGDRLLVVRPQVQRVNHLANDYYWTTATAVMGIISRRVP